MKPQYTVKFFWGNYSVRQRDANKDGAALYIEHHFNSSGNLSAGGVEVLVASNASATSKAAAAFYAAQVSARLGVRLRHTETSGVVQLTPGQNGHGNLVHTNMPAILLESCFVSNPDEAAIVKSEKGQTTLAECLADTVRKFVPKGGLVAFSVGHKGKTSSPADRGAPVHGGGTEAEYAEKVMLKAKAMLENA